MRRAALETHSIERCTRWQPLHVELAELLPPLPNKPSSQAVLAEEEGDQEEEEVARCMQSLQKGSCSSWRLSGSSRWVILRI